MVEFETKIKELCKRYGSTQKSLYAAIGVTDAGMRKMYARNSCEVALLEKIAGYFNVPVAEFFGENVKVDVPDVGSGSKEDWTMDRLLAMLEEKDKQIARLLGIIERR